LNSLVQPGPARLWFQMIAVFFLFSVVGFLVDLVYVKGQMQYAVVLVIATISGLNVMLWVFVLARLPKALVLPLIVLQFFLPPTDPFTHHFRV
jgi:cytochrome c oxidase subunit IV